MTERLRAARQFLQGVALLAAALLPLALLARLAAPEPDVVLGPARVYEGVAVPSGRLTRQAPLTTGSVPYLQARAPALIHVLDSLSAEEPTATPLERELLGLVNEDRTAQALPLAEFDAV